MFNDQFYHELLRKYVIVFGNLFNNISINRKNAAGVIQQTIKVPLNYGPRDKSLSLLDEKPDFVPQNAVILPRMSFEMISMNYAPQRKLNTVGKRYQATGSDTTRMKYQYNPVPYDLNFSLSIMVKNADDGAQILEQILPYFTPEFTLTMKPVSDMDIVQDIPIVLQGVTTEDTYEGNYEQRRALIHTLDFIVKGYFYGPTRNSEVIKSVQVDFGIPSGTLTNTEETPRSSRLTIVPKVGGVAATATANLTSNSVNAVTIVNQGDNYSNTIPTVTFSSPTITSSLIKFGTDAREHTSNTQQTTLVSMPETIVTGTNLGYQLRFWIYPRSADSDWKTIFHTTRHKLFYNGTTGVLNFSFVSTMTSGSLALNFDQWNFVVLEHIGVSARFHVNGQLASAASVGSSQSTWVLGEEVKVGFAAADDSIADYATDSFTGAIDNVIMNKAEFFVASAISPPSVAETGEVFTVDFDTINAQGVAVLTSNGNSVKSVTVTNGGLGYTSEPTVTIAAPIGTKTLAQIEANNNFGFGITRNFYTDNKKYNPVNDEDEEIS